MLLLTNCRKDEITTSDDISSIPDTENAKFQFLISNNNGQSITNAQIKIQAQTYETDENGMCITNSYNLPLEGLRAEISAIGFESLIIIEYPLLGLDYLNKEIFKIDALPIFL